MVWTKFDDAAAKSPKAQKAGNEAWNLWCAAVMYCNRHLTDGFVPTAALATECLPEPLTMAKANKLAERLVNAWIRPGGKGLFERGDGGFWVHDFLDWNDSKAVVEERRRVDRNRKSAGRGRVLDSGEESARTSNRTSERIPRGRRADSEPPRASPVLSDPAVPDHAGAPARDGGGAPPETERESRCPLDLVSRAESLGILREFAELAGTPVDAIRRHAEEFVGYWTIGGGAGKARRNWLGKLRQRLLELNGQGKLVDPDAASGTERRRPQWTDPDPGPKGPVVPPPADLMAKIRRVGRP